MGLCLIFTEEDRGQESREESHEQERATRQDVLLYPEGAPPHSTDQAWQFMS